MSEEPPDLCSPSKKKKIVFTEIPLDEFNTATVQVNIIEEDSCAKSSRNNNFKCTRCSFSTSGKVKLRNHLESAHLIKLETEEYLFDGPEDFNLWVKEEEKKLNVRFSRINTGAKKKENSRLYYLSCMGPAGLDCNDESICVSFIKVMENFSEDLNVSPTLLILYNKPHLCHERNIDIHKCSICDKGFTSLNNLSVHLEKYQRSGYSCDVDREIFPCPLCLKTFTRKNSLIRHQKNKHMCAPPSKKMKKGVICPSCKEKFLNKKSILEHFSKIHDYHLERNTVKFNNLEEFKIWKKQFEAETFSRFIKKGSYKSGQTTYCSYICHRSGSFESRGFRKRSLKMQGSNKIGGYCPASIKTSIFSDGQCSVDYINTHIGHVKDLCHLNLTEEDRLTLAAKISNNVPLDAILDEIRDNVSDEIKRLDLLTRKDLLNIAQSFKLNSASSHKSEENFMKGWIEQHWREHKKSLKEVSRNSLAELNEENPCVLYYKRKGSLDPRNPKLKENDFILILMTTAQANLLKQYHSDCICVDETIETNGTDFGLTTLLILNDLQQGFPCCFLISNRIDSNVISIFYNSLKKAVGNLISRSFMSGLKEYFFTNWFKIMEVSEDACYKFLCTWHLDEAWRDEINKKVKTKEKRKTVYHLLRTLLEANEYNFKSKIESKEFFDLFCDPDTKDFSEFLNQEFFVDRPASMWAHCHKSDADLKALAQLERMHKSMKFMFLRGKVKTRLDKAIHAIMKFLGDKLIDRAMCLRNGKITCKIKDLEKKHQLISNLVHKKFISNFVTVVNSPKRWQVKSFTKGKTFYMVSVNRLECLCDIICRECFNVCIHNFICECKDSAVMWNMCKHIHLVCHFLGAEQLRQEILVRDEVDVSSSHMDNTIQQEEINITSEEIDVENGILFENNEEIMIQNGDEISVETQEIIDPEELTVQSKEIVVQNIEDLIQSEDVEIIQEMDYSSIVLKETLVAKKLCFLNEINEIVNNCEYPEQLDHLLKNLKPLRETCDLIKQEIEIQEQLNGESFQISHQN